MQWKIDKPYVIEVGWLVDGTYFTLEGVEYPAIFQLQLCDDAYDDGMLQVLTESGEIMYKSKEALVGVVLELDREDDNTKIFKPISMERHIQIATTTIITNYVPDSESCIPPENKGDWIVYFRTARDDGKVEAFWEYFETEKEAIENQAEVRPAVEKHVTIKAEFCGLKKDCKELIIE